MNSIKIFLEKDVFLEKIETASRFTSSKLSTTSILQGILIEGKEKVINFFSTDLSLFYHGLIKNEEGTGDFKIIIEPRKIIEFLSLLDEDKVEVEIKEKTIKISQRDKKGEFSLIKPEEFPLPPKIKIRETKVDFKKLAEKLPLVLFSTAKDESRPVLTGVNFIEYNGKNNMVSTDGFRLSLVMNSELEEAQKMLVPADFLSEVLRQAKQDKNIFFGSSEEEKTVCFQIGEDSFFSRLIEGEFPPFEKVIPTDKKTTAIVEKEEFIKNVKLISIFARDLSNIIICRFSKEGLLIRPKTSEGLSENSTKQEAEIEGEEQRVAFNYKFVLDFLENIKEERVVVEVLRPDAPIVFKGEKNKDFLHIIMPVRIQEE